MLNRSFNVSRSLQSGASNTNYKLVEMSRNDLINFIAYRKRVVNKKDSTSSIFGELNNNSRSELILSRSALTIDIDNKEGLSEKELLVSLVQSLPKDVFIVIHNTFSSTKETPRLRVIVPLAEDLDLICAPDSYKEASERFASEFLNIKVDECSYVPKQLMFDPAFTDDNARLFYMHFHGDTYDPSKTYERGCQNFEIKTVKDFTNTKDGVTLTNFSDASEEFNYLYNPKPHLSQMSESVKDVIRYEHKATVLESTEMTLEEMGELNKAESILEKLSSDIERADWIAIGIALRNISGGKSEGLELFKRWSKKDYAEYSEQEVTERWGGFKERTQGRPAGVGKIIEIAKKYGVTLETQHGQPAELTTCAVTNYIASVTSTIDPKTLYFSKTARGFYEFKNGQLSDKPFNYKDIEVMCNASLFRKTYKQDLTHLLTNNTIIPAVYDVGWLPGEGLIVDVDGKKYLNTYNYDKHLIPNELSDEGRYFSHVFDKHWSGVLTTEDLDLFYSVLRHIILQPEKPIRFLTIIQSWEGVGKSILATLMSNILGGKNVGNVAMADLNSNFSEWMEGHTLKIIDEIAETRVTYERSRSELRERLKNFITNPKVSITRKGVKSKEVRVTASVLAFTNYKDSISLHAGDRRYLVLSSKIQTKNDFDNYLGFDSTDHKKINDFYEPYAQACKEPRHALQVARYIIDRGAPLTSLTTAPNTRGKVEFVEAMEEGGFGEAILDIIDDAGKDHLHVNEQRVNISDLRRFDFDKRLPRSDKVLVDALKKLGYINKYRELNDGIKKRYLTK